MGVAAGIFNPTQSYYAVDRGSADTRYGFDTQAATQRATNAADNSRALTERGMQEKGLLARQYAEPIKIGQGETAFLPGQTAAATGLSPVLAGTPKPLSETEWQASQNERLRQSGSLTDQQIYALATRDAAVEQIIDPMTGKPKIVYRSDAVGQQPYVKPTADSSTEISRLITERDQLPQGDPNRSAYDARIQALGRGQQQSAYDKTDDENLATLNADIYKAGTGAVGDRTTLTRLQEAVANPDTPQGAMAGTNLALRKTLTAFGVPAGDTSEAEMINALGNQLALRLRDPSNGAGMPGSLSDSDRNFLQSMAVSLGNSPEANKKLVAYYLRLQSKNIDLENLRRDYVKDHGRLDEGFRNLVGDYLQKTGVYAEGGGSTPGAPAGAGTPAAPALPNGQTFDTPGGPVRFRRLD